MTMKMNFFGSADPLNEKVFVVGYCNVNSSLVAKYQLCREIAEQMSLLQARNTEQKFQNVISQDNDQLKKDVAALK
ncbi:hypothetical protein ACS0TY_000153 [Phlomoides rotata]